MNSNRPSLTPSEKEERKRIGACRKLEYETQRTLCKENPSECEVAKKCGSEKGFGSDLWPYDKWFFTPEEIQKLGGQDEVGRIKKCISEELWSKDALKKAYLGTPENPKSSRERIAECGGDQPNFNARNSAVAQRPQTAKNANSQVKTQVAAKALSPVKNVNNEVKAQVKNVTNQVKTQVKNVNNQVKTQVAAKAQTKPRPLTASKSQVQTQTQTQTQTKAQARPLTANTQAKPLTKTESNASKSQTQSQNDAKAKLSQIKHIGNIPMV